MHELRLVHTDLKPENILLVSSDYSKVPQGVCPTKQRRVPNSSRIKLIDFGSATFENHYHSAIVSTRHYRAPEVILGLGWTYPCDVWSVGCILVELLTGDALFQTHENLEHLAIMERVLGPIPKSMSKRADRHSSKYFLPTRELNWPAGASSRESIRAVRCMRSLDDLVYAVVGYSPAAAKLYDLLKGLLCYESDKRLSAKAALQHKFFKDDVSSQERSASVVYFPQSSERSCSPPSKVYERHGDRMWGGEPGGGSGRSCPVSERGRRGSDKDQSREYTRETESRRRVPTLSEDIEAVTERARNGNSNKEKSARVTEERLRVDERR